MALATSTDCPRFTRHLARVGCVLTLMLAPWSLQAQAPATDLVPEPQGRNPRIERLTHEDRLGRIDELRVAGRTQSIVVQPRHGAAYAVDPAAPGQAPGAAASGRARWSLRAF